MKEFWVDFSIKERFIDAIRGHHITELCEPEYRMTFKSDGMAVIKYYKYRVDITTEEYVFLKLMFDLKEEL